MSYRFFLFFSGFSLAFSGALGAFSGSARAQCVGDQSPLKILPVGDSITQGGKGFSSWRRSLSQRLADRCVDFVGCHTRHFEDASPSCDFDPDHEGYWGTRIDQMIDPDAGRLAASLSGQKHLNNDPSQPLCTLNPDVALVHLGTNDVFARHTAASTKEELRSVIGLLRSRNPQIHIFLAQVIPYGTQDAAAIALLTAVNVAIAELVQEENAAAIPAAPAVPYVPIHLVDMNTGFNPTQGTGMTHDWVHPNEAGEDFIAARWQTALVPLLDQLGVANRSPAPFCASLDNGGTDALTSTESPPLQSVSASSVQNEADSADDLQSTDNRSSACSTHSAPTHTLWILLLLWIVSLRRRTGPSTIDAPHPR